MYWALGWNVVGVMGYWFIAIQAYPPSWQLWQLPVTPVWICVVVGAGVRNWEPGAVSVALACIRPLGIVPIWHCSQLVPDAMCADGLPAGVMGGITTILEIPTNEDGETVGP